MRELPFSRRRAERSENIARRARGGVAELKEKVIGRRNDVIIHFYRIRPACDEFSTRQANPRIIAVRLYPQRFSFYGIFSFDYLKTGSVADCGKPGSKIISVEGFRKALPCFYRPLFFHNVVASSSSGKQRDFRLVAPRQRTHVRRQMSSLNFGG